MFAQSRTLFPQALANAPELRARIVHDLAGGIDLAPDVGDLRLEAGRGGRYRAQDRVRSATAADGCGGCFDRGEEVGERQELAWIEGAAFHRQRGQARVEVIRCAESDGGFRQETNGLGRGVQSRRHLARLDERRQARQPGQTGRRLCEAADRFDDAIEFESPEGAGVHER